MASMLGIVERMQVHSLLVCLDGGENAGPFMASMLGIGERMQVHSLLTCGGWRRTLNAGGLFFASVLGVGDGTSAWLPYSDCCIKCHE